MNFLIFRYFYRINMPVWNRWQLHRRDYIFSPLARPQNISTTCACLLSVKRSGSFN